MKYGAMNFPIRPIHDELDRIAGLGFDYIEISMDPPCAHYTDILKIEKKLVSSLEKYNMDVLCHLPTFVYSADLTKSIRDASLQEMKNSIKAASQIGVKKAVLHPSFTTGMGVFVMDDIQKFSLDAIDIILEQADKSGIILCLENMYPRYNSFFDPSHFKTVFELFPNLKMTLDTGHANMDDPSKNKLYQFVDLFSDRIDHVHISDNLGKTDDHFAVGKGTVNFKKFGKSLKKTGFNNTITLEIFSLLLVKSC